MKCIILAAGYGTRLYPLTKDKPKALLEITKNKLMIDYIIDKIPKEITDISLVTNEKFFPLFEEWKKHADKRFTIQIFNDGTSSNETRLGGIGDLLFALEKIGQQDVLVLGSDNLFDFSLDEAYSFFTKSGKDAILAYDLQGKDDARKFGVISIDAHKKIIKFEEKPQHPDSDLVSTAIYFFSKETLSLLQGYLASGNNKDGPGYFVKWLYPKQDVYCFPATGEWYDIGSIESYNEVREQWKDKA